MLLDLTGHDVSADTVMKPAAQRRRAMAPFGALIAGSALLSG
jgi:hypothetical protein